MPIAAITTTPAGLRCLAPVCQSLSADLRIADDLGPEAEALGIPYQGYGDSLRAFLAQHWAHYDSFIFCLATGAVVRLIAPLLQDKATDPAIVVVDEAGQVAISLCGGHQGGADRLAQQVSHSLDAQAILTGAANRLALPGIDILGAPFGWAKGAGDWTGVSAAVAQGHPVQVIQDSGTRLWQVHLPAHHPFQFQVMSASPERPVARLWISPTQRHIADVADHASPLPSAQWHPRVLWVGIGCERGTSRDLIEAAIEQTCQTHQLATAAIAGIASLDLKADEAGLLELCQARHWPLRCFSADALKHIPVPHPSAIVETAVGTPSVAEAAALLAAAPPATPYSVSPLLVSKHIFRQPDSPGAVTLAIAQANREYIGRSGQLWLVGTGPGCLDQITPAAKTAIGQADAVIGYSLYLDLIRPLLRPGQILETFPLTQEKQRAERAIDLARWGLTVAVVSSGDCGIYGMAGLVLETLKAQGWDGVAPAVQVLPGISALQAAASRVGAPLMHDFCAISLSDLLTPWPVIQKRLEAAAQADFVVALYNPKSKTRTTQIADAQEILLRHRAPDTPVALARSLYRPQEDITLTTLSEMLTHPIDMLTTVLIGNQSSVTHAGWLITPRGYLGFSSEHSTL